jgi:hypothetical protein
VNILDVAIENPITGVYIYKNTLPKELDFVNRLEKVIEENNDDWFVWRPAMVGHQQVMKDYRDCVDFKVHRGVFDTNQKAATSDLKNIYDEIDERLKVCLEHYCSIYNLKMEFQEAVNFVRYSEGQHFRVHSDSGFSYTCTVSSVMYLNDDYTGGGLWFPHVDYTYQPEAGDIVLFPSNFLFAHAALPVEQGTKYSAVTMFDYNDKNHK